MTKAQRLALVMVEMVGVATDFFGFVPLVAEVPPFELVPLLLEVVEGAIMAGLVPPPGLAKTLLSLIRLSFVTLPASFHETWRVKYPEVKLKLAGNCCGTVHV